MRNKIITELYNSKQLRDILRNAAPLNLRDDLKSELIMVVCGLTEKRLVEMYDKKELNYYLCAVAANMMSSTESKFGKMYRYKDGRQLGSDFNWQEETLFEGCDNELVWKGLNKRFALHQDAENDISERTEKENFEDKVADIIEAELSWHDNAMVKAYIKYGSYGSVRDNVGIPKTTVYDAVKKAKKKVQQALKQKGK